MDKTKCIWRIGNLWADVLHMHKLDTWMSKKGLCDRQVAIQIKVSRPTISRIRRGKTGASTRVAMKLQELTGINWSNFLKHPPVIKRKPRGG